jgi:hypothetical protein
LRKITPVAVITVVVLGTVWTLNQNQLISIPFISPEVTESKAVPANQPSVHHHDAVVKRSSSGHTHGKKIVQISKNIEDYIEQQQIRAEDIPITNNGDGTYTVDLENQWSTATIAIIDEHGKKHMIERQIKPIGTVVLKK